MLSCRCICTRGCSPSRRSPSPHRMSARLLLIALACSPPRSLALQASCCTERRDRHTYIHTHTRTHMKTHTCKHTLVNTRAGIWLHLVNRVCLFPDSLAHLASTTTTAGSICTHACWGPLKRRVTCASRPSCCCCCCLWCLCAAGQQWFSEALKLGQRGLALPRTTAADCARG